MPVFEAFASLYPSVEKIEKLQQRASKPNAPCSKQMLAWADCVKTAQASYPEEVATINPNTWAAYHLRKCLHPYVDARECQVEKMAKVVKGMKEHVTEEQWAEAQQKMRFVAHKSIGTEKFDQTWKADMDYSGYFKAYRSYMEEQFKLEDELKVEIANPANGGVPQEPYKFLPKPFVYKGN
ncbi:expressed unknown protein [Seminavis robusta]|uniref:Uncharacterized protein n=1 Tax=Seminavis robusta TaxID=568900 RepID=A0A9N8HIU5_9STRA|nr:expressed unknown protein [Seminavis robusta]|eukprot:Sro646_g180750.1 n/a (181) ;mRNA; r:29955-30612